MATDVLFDVCGSHGNRDPDFPCLNSMTCSLSNQFQVVFNVEPDLELI